MPEKRANIVVFKNKNILLSHKKILIILVIILITLPVTVFLALNRQNFLNYADAGAVIETIEVSPGEVRADINTSEPVYLSALAYDSFGDPVYYLDVNYEWSMSSTNSVGTLSNTSGEITQFKPLSYGCGQITITASWTQEVVTKSILVAVSDGENVPNCSGEATPTIAPTVPVCTQSTIPPDSGPAPLTVLLHGSGMAGGTDSTIEGYQWDFENDGIWDTEAELDPLSHTYENSGIYTPKYRILGSNGFYSEICDYKYEVIVDSPVPASFEFQSIKLHGIGKGGDNVNASASGNLNPLRSTRYISIHLEDGIGNSFSAGVGEINYSSGSGVFSGSILLDESIPNGDYLVKIKLPQYLRRQVGGIIKVIKGEVSKISEVSLVAGDINDNNSVDISDYNLLIDCYSDLLPAKNCSDENKKTASDLSDDGLVNADDYNLFIRELSALNGD